MSLSQRCASWACTDLHNVLQRLHPFHIPPQVVWKQLQTAGRPGCGPCTCCCATLVSAGALHVPQICSFIQAAFDSEFPSTPGALDDLFLNSSESGSHGADGGWSC